MARYTLPEPGNSRPTVESLEGRLLAIEPSKVAVEPTKFGEKLVARARVVEIRSDGTWDEVDDDFLFAQMVLVEDSNACSRSSPVGSSPGSSGLLKRSCSSHPNSMNWNSSTR
jgi:hypothetical protein